MDYRSTKTSDTSPIQSNTQFLTDEKRILYELKSGPEKQIMDQQPSAPQWPTTEQKADDFRRTAGYYDDPTPRRNSGLDVVDVIIINQAMSGHNNNTDCSCGADCCTCTHDALSGIGHCLCSILEGIGSMECSGCDISI